MATEADLAAWTASTGRDWDQMCQAWTWNLCAHFGHSAGSQASALTAYYNSNIVSSDIWSAPAGSFVYLDIGQYGHVLTVVDDGTGMGSARVAIPWGINAGEIGLADYIAQTGADPLGWSWDNAGSTYTFEAAGSQPEPPEEEDDMGDFNTMRDDAGSIYFADIWGAESILDYFDPGVALEEGINAVTALGGPSLQVANRQRDVMASIINNRRARVIDSIADAVIRKQSEPDG